MLYGAELDNPIKIKMIWNIHLFNFALYHYAKLVPVLIFINENGLENKSKVTNRNKGRVRKIKMEI